MQKRQKKRKKILEVLPSWALQRMMNYIRLTPSVYIPAVNKLMQNWDVKYHDSWSRIQLYSKWTKLPREIILVCVFSSFTVHSCTTLYILDLYFYSLFGAIWPFVLVCRKTHITHSLLSSFWKGMVNVLLNETVAVRKFSSFKSLSPLSQTHIHWSNRELNHMRFFYDLDRFWYLSVNTYSTFFSGFSLQILSRPPMSLE